MAAKLTVKQQLVYDFVRKEIKRNGYAPSVREICDGVGLSSTSTVHAHLETLRKKGYIKRFPSKNRTIEILEDGFYAALRDYSPVPIVSKITKDESVLQKENITGFFLVPNSYINGSECFIHALGEDCDAEKVKSGDLVLVMFDGSAKPSELMLVFDSGKVALRRQEEKKYSKKEIVGKIIALFRRY